MKNKNQQNPEICGRGKLPVNYHIHRKSVKSRNFDMMEITHVVIGSSAERIWS
jgi:hypothetical protein